MTTKPQHTPTKLEVAQFLSSLIDNKRLTLEEQTICHHIAHAVNCHDELVEALTEIIADVECYCSDNPRGICPIHKAKQAIAKAEGKIK